MEVGDDLCASSYDNGSACSGDVNDSNDDGLVVVVVVMVVGDHSCQ